MLIYCNVVIVCLIAVQPREGKILVLGSAGLVGTALTTHLKQLNYDVVEVRDRKHIDLRVPNSLDQFHNVSFCFFLACEVGGSKFIDSKQDNIQLSIITHNLQIYQTVFPYLTSRNIPYLFTSSYLQSQPTSYGSVKRLGESWISAAGSESLGKTVRLWNIYGNDRTNHCSSFQRASPLRI